MTAHGRSEAVIPPWGDGPQGKGGDTTAHGRSEAVIPPWGDGPQGSQ